MGFENKVNSRGRKSNLEEILDNLDLNDLKEENFLATVKKLREAEKKDDTLYTDEFNRYNYRSTNYSKFLNPKTTSERQKRFFLGKIIHCGKKALDKYNDNYREKGFKKEIFESKIGTAYIDLAKTSASCDFRRKWIERGILFLKEAIEDLIFYRSDDETKKKIYGFTGQAFSNTWTIRTTSKNGEESGLDNLKESDLENLVMGIACQELSRDNGNIGAVNYQAIGREYYNLQHLIRESGRNQAGEINVKMIGEKIREVLDKKGKNQEKILENYQGSLRQILELKNESKLAQEMQFIAVKSAYESFVKSHKPPGKIGDDSLDNKSYRGSCLVDMVRLNKWLNKFDSNEARRKLDESKLLLEKVVDGREDELNGNRKESKEYDYLEGKLAKDYTRLSECYFRLADGDITQDREERRKLYRKVIELNEEAIKHGRDISEVHSFIATSLFKIAEISTDNTEKKQNLEDAVKIFESLSDKDYSAENRSKKGACHLRLLELELEEVKHPLWERWTHNIFSLLGIKTKIDKRINQAKEALEEAVEINKKKKGDFVYPYFLLYFLSKDIEEKREKCGLKSLEEYGLQALGRYVEEAFEIYSEKNPNWVTKRIWESKNLVIESEDNYGLLDDVFVLKKGDEDSLRRERKITEELRERLTREFLENRKYSTPRPHHIFKHEDEDTKLAGWYYAMSHKHGSTLGEILQDGKRTDEEKTRILKNVVDYLGFIHANLNSNLEQQDYRSKAKERLEELVKKGICNSIANQILDNYQPILDSFKDARLVFWKDAHPGNWLIIPDSSIVALDFEDKGMVPLEFDLASLLQYRVNITEKEKSVIHAYGASLKKRGISFEFNEIRYFNVVIHRAISLVGAWCAEGRTSMHAQGIFMFNNSLKAIDELKQNHTAYYSKYSKNYEELYREITKLKERYTEIRF